LLITIGNLGAASGFLAACARIPFVVGVDRMLPPAFGRLLQAHYEEAVHRRQPMLHLILLSALDQARSYVRLLMPLSEDGATVTMLMTVDSKQQNTKALRDYFQQAVEGRR